MQSSSRSPPPPPYGSIHPNGCWELLLSGIRYYFKARMARLALRRVSVGNKGGAAR